MTTFICIMILAYCLTGKDVRALLAKVKDVDWRGKMNVIYAKIRPYALKAGRTAAKPLLQFYYVMVDVNTSTLECVLIYAALFYTVSPISFIPYSVFKLLGVLDEGAAMLYVYRRIKDKITPEINRKVEDTLNDWFGESVVILA